jgi:hypothetical protein
MSDIPLVFEHHSTDPYDRRAVRGGLVLDLFQAVLALVVGVLFLPRGDAAAWLGLGLIAAIFGLRYVVGRWVWKPMTVRVIHRLDGCRLLVRRVYQRGASSSIEEKQYELRDLVAIRVLEEASETPGPGQGILILRPKRLRLLLQSDTESAPRQLDLGRPFLKATEKTREKLLSELKSWHDVCASIEWILREQALPGRWSKLNAYGRYRLVLQLAEFSALGGAPSTRRMLRASFQGILGAIGRGLGALLRGYVWWFHVILWLVIAVAVGMFMTSILGWRGMVEEWLDGIPAGVKIAAIFLAFFVGAAYEIVEWFRPLSLDGDGERSAIAASLIKAAQQKREFDPILKLVDDAIDRVKSVLDRLTVLTVMGGLLPKIMPGVQPAVADGIAVGAGIIAVVMQLYLFTQSRILRIAKSACLIAQSVQPEES